MRELRLKFIFLGIFTFALIIVGRLYYLQVIKKEYYQALAQGQHKIIKETVGERGRIFLRGGEIAATNKKGKFLYVCPKEIKEKRKTARLLAEISNLSEEDIFKKVSENNFFQLIKKRITKEEIKKLEKMDLKGVYLGEKNIRFYPYKELLAHITGFVNQDNIGQYGIEGYYQKELKGKSKIEEKLTTPFKYLNLFSSKDTIKGKDIYLTIDYYIQFQSEKLLEEAKEEFKIRSGQIIVAEPFSGEILAMVSLPSYNPNKYFEYAKEGNLEIFKNPTIQELYEPGSVLKPVVMAGAINEGRVTPETTFFDKGYVNVQGRIIRNWKKRVYGESSMSKILERSINTGAVFLEQKLGEELFLEYLKRFGFFEKTGIDLEGEIFSENSNLKKTNKINLATASFGQGIAITPIQLVRAFCAIANGGKLVKPHLRKGNVEIQNPQVISPKTATIVTNMLVNVVEKGYGKKAKIPGYYIAGKTGTAQIPWPALGIEKPGYSKETIHSFIGFAPAYNPKFLIYVKLNQPKGVSASEVSATKVFKKLAKYIIDYWKIAPDYERE